jgi:cell division protein YceG involved in septum cleavage
MNLSFHHGEEDFNASMSVLSIYHQDILDNFKFYALLQDQKFQKEENLMITLEGFIHFLKTLGFANNRNEINSIAEYIHEIDGFQAHIQEPLNIFNGMNYSQFLEAILRVAYFKKANNAELADHMDGYKNSLEGMFVDSTIDIKNRASEDKIFKQLYELSSNRYFEENFYLLGGVYSSTAALKDQGYLELSKNDFIKLL